MDYEIKTVFNDFYDKIAKYLENVGFWLESNFVEEELGNTKKVIGIECHI